MPIGVLSSYDTDCKNPGAKLRLLYESGGVIFVFSGMNFWFLVSHS